MSISLLDNEKVLKTTWPHPLSMLNIYFNWIYVICIGFLFIAMRSYIEAWIYTLPLGKQFSTQAFFCIWCSCLLLPSLVISFYYINWSWLFYGIVLSTSGAIITYNQDSIAILLQNFAQSIPMLKNALLFIFNYIPISAEQFFAKESIVHHFLILIGFIGLLSCNSYRKSHRYYLTNRRIIAHFGFISVRERDIIYSKVDDLIIQQGVLGRIFGFGTIIPISASGMGTGSDQVFAAVGIEGKLPMGPKMSVTIGGGRTITIPRAPSFYSLYGIKKPEEAKTIMLKEMQRREYRDTNKYKLSDMNKLSGVDAENTFM